MNFELSDIYRFLSISNPMMELDPALLKTYNCYMLDYVSLKKSESPKCSQTTF